MLAIFSVFTWFEIVFCLILFFPIQLVLFILTFLFDKRRWILHYHSSLWSTIILALSPLWKVEIKGKENLDRTKNHVVIMNHQSLIDIPIAFRLFYPVKLIGKKILGLVPFIGWNMVLSGHLLVDRKDLRSQMNTIRKMENIIKRKDSLLVFPEGTRSRDGNIGKFKKGAFRSAAITGASLLPVVIDGPYQILPRDGFIANRKASIKISILPSIDVEEGSDPGELALKTHEVMAKELELLRK